MSGGASVRALPQAESEEDYISRLEEKKKKTNGVSLSAKRFELPAVESPVVETPSVEEPTEDMTSGEAALRGFASGISFDLADDLVAAFKSLGGGTFQEELKKEKSKSELAQEKEPGPYYGGMAVGGAATMLIPGVGTIANTPRALAAAKALVAAKKAKDATAIAAANKILAKELIRGGAQTGAITGFGASEKDTAGGTALDIAEGAVTGGALGYAIPKAAEAVGEGVVTAGKRVRQAFPRYVEPVIEGAEKAKGAIKKAWEGERWQAFPGKPDKQRVVDEIVQSGKDRNLTDRQILNEIGVKFPELSRQDLEDIFIQKGVAGKFKRAIAGSQEAAEFIDRPEQMEYAEEATKGKTGAMARQEATMAATEAEIAERGTIKTKLQRESQDVTQKLSEKRQQLQKQWETADATQKQKINQELSKIDEAQKKLTDVLEQRKKIIEQYEQADKEMAETVKVEMEKAAKTRSEESLNKIAQIEQEIDERVKILGKQKVELVESLMDTPATDSEMKAAFDIQKNMQNIFNSEGLGKQGRQALNDAYGGDSRFDKVLRYFRKQQDIQDYNKYQEILQWNKDNGFWDAEKAIVKEGGRQLPRYPNLTSKTDIIITPEEKPTVGELVGALYAANSKVSSAAHENPLATVKRQVGMAIQEGMRDINAESYAIQRYLNSSKANLETLRASPLFESRKIPVVGPTGRIATPTVRMIKTEIPEDFASSAKKYRGIMSEITRGESMEAADISRAMKGAKEGLPVKPSPRIGQLQRDVGDIESRISELTAQRESILSSAEAAKPGIKLARGEEKRAALGETVKSKLDIRNKVREIDDEIAKLNKDLEAKGRRKAEMGETETQLQRTLLEARGVPASARDIAQFGSIAAQGKVPWISGKLAPRPKLRIQTINKIKNRFNNPALTSAVRVAIERPITTSVVKGLAELHGVDEKDLTAALQESGVGVSPEE